MAFSYEAKSKGDEEKAATAVRRLSEEDPTLDVHRDPQTGEQIIAGLTQVHVEVLVERMKEPLRRRDRAAPAARPLPGDDPPARPRRTPATRSRPAAKASSPTARSRSSRARTAAASSSSTRSRGRRSPAASSPRSRRASVEAMQHGTVAGYPVKDVRVRLVDGKHHDTDSSEMAFKSPARWPSSRRWRRPTRRCSSRS